MTILVYRPPVSSHQHFHTSQHIGKVGRYLSSVYCQMSSHDSFMEMELQLYSPSIKPHRGLADGKGTLPVFGERDQVKGKVILGRSCYHTGCLSISVRLSHLRYNIHISYAILQLDRRCSLIYSCAGGRGPCRIFRKYCKTKTRVLLVLDHSTYLPRL